MASAGAKLQPERVLRAGAPAGSEVKRLLSGLLEVLLANEEGVRQGDSESLHDFRVAVRRTRTALTQIRRVLPPRSVERFKPEFEWLGRLSGPTRDLDVCLARMAEYERDLPGELAGRLQPVRRFVEARRAEEWESVIVGLNSPRFRRLIVGWREVLQREPGGDSTALRVAVDILEVARRDIGRALRRLLERGRAIDGASAPGEMHRVRIDGKKLRYLLEFFRSLFDAGEIKNLIRSLKNLQDTLGDFNDYAVQRRIFSDFEEQRADTGIAGEEVTATSRLIDLLEQREAQARNRFDGHFAEFDSRANRRRFKRLLRANGSE